MSGWILISIVVGMCWVAFLGLGWLLCRTAKRADENGPDAPVVPLRPDRLPSAAQRR